jgi:hypothetical protein
MASPAIRWFVGSLGGNARGDADEAHRFLDTIDVKVRMAEMLAGRSMAGRSDFIEHEGRRRPHRHPGEGKADPERACPRTRPRRARDRREVAQAPRRGDREARREPRHPLTSPVSLPLENAGQIKPRKDGLDGGWLWRLTPEPASELGHGGRPSGAHVLARSVDTSVTCATRTSFCAISTEARVPGSSSCSCSVGW